MQFKLQYFHYYKITVASYGLLFPNRPELAKILYTD